MTNQNTITVRLIVNDDGSVVVKQFGKNAEDAINKIPASAPKATTALNTIKNSYLELTAKAATAYMMAKKAMDYIAQGAQAEQVESSFRIMAESAGANASQMIAAMRAATKETIDDSAMMQKAVKMMTLGFDPSQIERFSNVVITASQVAGTTSAEAYDRLSDAIATRMPRSLIQMGAVTKSQMKIVQAAIDAGADSTYLLELTIANLELKQKQLQSTQDASTLSVQRFKAQIDEAKEAIGGGLIFVTQRLFGVLQGVAVAALQASGGIFTLISHLPGTNKSEWQANATAAYEAAFDLAKKAQDNMNGYYERDKKATALELANKKARVIALEAEGIAIAEKAKADEKARQVAAKTAEEAKRLKEEWEKTATKINQAIELEDLTGLSRELKENEQAADNLKKQFEKLDPATRDAAYALIDKAKASADATARQNEQNQAEQDYLVLIRDEADELDKLIDYYSKIEGYEQRAYDLKLKRIEEERKAFIEANGDVAAANAKASQDQITALKEKIDAEQKGARDMIGYYSQMIDAAMTCYSEDSDEYKRLQDFKKAALAAELAMEISKNAQIIAGYFTQSAAAVAAAQVQNAANASTAVSGAVSSVAAQGTIPIAGFGLVAAMMAVMAGVLGIAGIAFGGGSTAMATPAATWTKSTVLGAEDGTGSESIANSLEILADTYDMENVKLTKIYEEVRDLNSNITGLVTSIVRTGGLSMSGVGLPSSTSSLEDFYNSSTFSLLSGGLGSWWSDQVFGGVSGNILAVGDILGGMPGLNIITDWVSGGLGSVISSAFGGEVSSQVYAQGIKFGSNLVKDIMAGASLAAKQYTNVLVTTSGGWFEGDDTASLQYTAALDASVTRMLSLVYKNLSTSLLYMADELGGDAEKVYKYAFKATQINLYGMSADEMNKALSEWFSSMADTAVEELFGDKISKYQELNEGLMETAMRLIRDKEIISQILELTDSTFRGTTAELIDFSESLIKAAGGLDKLTDAFTSYYEAFYSDEEKQADRQRSLQMLLAAYGYNLPSERYGYRGVVESIDKTTAVGMSAYYALMAAAETADEYYKYLESATTNINPSDYSTNLEYQRALAGLPHYADGGSLMGGYALVGETGPELAYFDTPARIYSNKDTVKMASNKELVSEIKALRTELMMSNFANADNAQQTLKYLKYIQRWEKIGMPTERTN